MESEAASRHAQVKVLFGEVIDLAAADRAARLRELTDDTSLIAEVERLCAREGSSTSRFARPVAAAMAQLADDELNVGDRLGAWELVAEIGHGGMGSVYEAKRIDGHFEQVAAIKVLRGVPSAGALEYLARERQILAKLSHPNIARLLEGGATPRGRPYLVMERIEGEAIDKHCEARKLSRAAMLRLFVTACEAIGFAHQQLVVHCDLKPNNILVDARGRVVLLDFGIARLVDSAAVELEAASDPAYTPRYASPEQRAGGRVSTTTDIYSLGVMLGELLGPDAPAELRAIAAKATLADPADRYATAYALARDIDRFGAREPVLAFSTTPAYAARKFVQRRWPLVAAVVAFVFTVALFAQRVVSERDRARDAEHAAVESRDRAIGAETAALRDRDRATVAEKGTAVERDRAQSAESAALRDRDRSLSAERAAVASERSAVADRNRAEVSQNTAAKLNDFLLSIFENTELVASGSPDIPATKIIDAAQARIESELKGQPETQSAIYVAMARINRNLGRPRVAIASFERAIALEGALGRSLPRAELQIELARLRTMENEQILAEKDAREATKVIETLAGPESPAAASAYGTLGLTLAYRGKYVESEELLVRALALTEKIHGPESIEAAAANYSLGRLYKLLNLKRAQAVPYFEHALAIRTRLEGERSPRAMEALESLAETQSQLGRIDEGLNGFRKAVALREAVHGPRSEALANALDGLGETFSWGGKPMEGVATLRQAVAIRAQVSGTVTTGYALALTALAHACADAGDIPCAEAQYREAHATLSKTLPPTSGLTSRLLMHLGTLLLRNGRVEEGSRVLDEAYRAKVASFGERDSDAVEARGAQAYGLLLMGDPIRARAYLQQIEARAMSMTAAGHSVFLYQRGLVAAGEGRYREGLDDLAAAAQRWGEARGTAHPRLWYIELDRLEILASAGQRREAAEGARVLEGRISSQLVPTAPARERLRKLQVPGP